MTIDEAIKEIDTLKPNAYPEDIKLRWLSRIDGTIKREVIDTHEGGDAMPFAAYSEDQLGQGVQLLVPEPYSELYVHYLACQIDLSNAETARYNNSSIVFNTAYQTFTDWYNRTHIPLQRHSIRTT